MSRSLPQCNRRVLVIDDSLAIQEDFRKVLCPELEEVDPFETRAFGASDGSNRQVPFEVEFASQGQQGLEMVQQAGAGKRPYAVAFIDVRMPPGWDGVETTSRIWQVDPDLQVVICTAYSDYSWEEMTARLGRSDRLVILKKPFDHIEVLQMASAMSEKWRLNRQSRIMVRDLEQSVAALRESEEKLRRSEAEFRVTFENAAIGMALMDIDGHPLKSNAALQRLLGYSEEELRGMAFSEFTHPDDVEADLALYREMLAGKREHYQFEKRCLRKGGQVVHARLTTSVVRGPAGKAQYSIGMVEDITEKKQMEAQFLRAQRLESIGTLAGGIAHDLNNVLAPILMSCELLQMDARDEEACNMIGMIKASAERGASLVKQVLSFARGVEAQRIPVPLKQLMREMANFTRGTFPKSIRIQSHIPKNLWALSGDATQLHQVLLNLCVNARDAMPAGGELTMTAENIMVETRLPVMDPDTKPGPHVVIKVTDTGTGIPPAIREKIFDPFFTTKEAGQGTGLGLSTTLGIVKSHGGFVKVDSEPGQGSTFEVWLPAELGKELATPQVEEARLPRGNGERILVVDDEASLRALTRQTLEAYGYVVLTAANGGDALAIYSRHKDGIDVVLTDMMMPVMDGVALTLAVRKMNPVVRVLATSGLSDKEHQSKALGAGARLFLPKPYNAEMLLNSLAEILHDAEMPSLNLPPAFPSAPHDSAVTRCRVLAGE